MGSAVGHVLAAGGARVVATLEHRSARTAKLAEGIELLPSLDAVVEASHIVLSIVPPGEALAVAGAVADAAGRTGAQPIVADLNAIAPATMAAVAERLESAGLSAVDGSISGPPPRRAGATIVYLSGVRAAEVASLPAPGLELRVVGERIGMASAIKMSTGSFYKGQTGAARPGAPGGPRERRARARARRPPPQLPRARRRCAAHAAEHRRQVGPLRRRDAGDRRDPGAGGLDARSLRGVRDRLPAAQRDGGCAPGARSRSIREPRSRTCSRRSTARPADAASGGAAARAAGAARRRSR